MQQSNGWIAIPPQEEEYEHKLEKLIKFCSPMMTRMHQQGGTAPPICGGAGGCGFGGGSYKGPTVVEVG